MTKLKFLIIVSALFLSYSGCAIEMPSNLVSAANTIPGEVAFNLAGPGEAAIVVPVQINGEGPFNFVLDTGATLTCVVQELVQKLKLPEQRGVYGMGAGINSQGNFQVLKIDSLQVGTAKATNITGCSIDLQNIKSIGLDAQGLLGLNFLKSYRVTIDFEHKILQLQK